MDTQDGGWKEGGRVHFYFLGIRAQLFMSGFYLRRSLQVNGSTSEPIPSPLSPKVYRVIALLFILKAVLMAGDKICFQKGNTAYWATKAEQLWRVLAPPGHYAWKSASCQITRL